MMPFTRPMYSAVLVATLVFAPAVARATFHENVIDEVMSGFNGDPTFEYVELRADAPGQNFVNTARLAVFDSTGTRTDLVTSGHDVANGLTNRKILYATAAFQTTTGIAPDFTFPSGMLPPTGLLCWGKPGDPALPSEYIDCVGYGGYTGPPAPTHPPSTSLGLGDGTLSLTRIAGTIFSQGSNQDDFALRVPGPCNNAGQCAVLGATGCGNGNVDPGEQCDDGNLTSGDGCENDCTWSPNTPTPGVTPTAAEATPPADRALTNPIRSLIRKGPIRVKLETVATGLTAPLWGITAPGNPGRLYVVDQMGILWAVDIATGAKTTFLDVTQRIVTLGVFGPGSFDERGFLGLVFAPDYQTSGLLYTYTSEPVSTAADFSTMPPGSTPDCQSVLAEWHVPNPTDSASVVDPASRRELLRIDKPQFNHNGGTLLFGPDGKLYLATGDGGGADDSDGETFFSGEPSQGAIETVGHGSIGNGQNTGVILGKMLRLDPHGTNSANGKYGIPADNPFVGQPGFLGEIFAYGLRNPWRMSFDPANGTGFLYVGDVGQNEIEEVDVVIPGGNYGWNHKEGRFFFGSAGAGPGYVSRKNPGDPRNLIDPVAQYDHNDGLAVIGGFVYRGTRVPQLVGRYVFGDFARTFQADGRLFYLHKRDVVRFGRMHRSAIGELQLTDRDALHLALLGFGQDANGEVYVLANGGGVPFDTTGVVLRIAPSD